MRTFNWIAGLVVSGWIFATARPAQAQEEQDIDDDDTWIIGPQDEPEVAEPATTPAVERAPKPPTPATPPATHELPNGAFPQGWPHSERPEPAKLNAAEFSPFLELGLGGYAVEDRFGTLFVPSADFGLLLGGRIRLTARVGLLLDPDVDHGTIWSENGDFRPHEPEEPKLIWGGSAGLVLANTKSFMLSPGLAVLRTDVSGYGTMFLLAVPFEWVRTNGFRIGFDVAIGRAVGGNVSGECGGWGGSATCVAGEIRRFDRDEGTAFYSSFFMGWSLGRAPSRK